MGAVKTNNRAYWAAWIALTLLVGGVLAWILFKGQDKTFYMPGPLSDGHHQLAEACDVCHTDSFGGGEVLQDACVECHGAERVKPFDSHPRSKFTDPRNADRLEAIDALHCVTCHTEHRPEITQKNGLTQPRDLCFHCHQDIAEDRPSHAGMEFDTCHNSGCHSFHNNRALYTDFLLKHADDPDLKERAKVPGREFANILEELYEYPRDRYPVEELQADDADAPATHLSNAAINADWLASRHAATGVNCTACHQPVDEQGNATAWTDSPPLQACDSCHNLEVKRFGAGKHGMRLAAGLSPMTPEHARLPMLAEAKHEQLTCNSCHGAHDYDVRQAAVDGCLQCHDDQHSKAYKDSSHYALWQAEMNGEAAENSGVSCATCHMPRVDFDVNDWMSRVMVDHNQSATLSPNSKMIRPACLHCHGLGFSIDALADTDLIDKNFNGVPAAHVESIDLAVQDQERYLRELEQSKQSNR